MRRRFNGGKRRPPHFRTKRKVVKKDIGYNIHNIIKRDNEADNNAKNPQPAHKIKHSFSDFDLDTRIRRNVEAKGFSAPTPIQDQAIPLIMQGRDLVGIANTGTGKTGAFLLPLIHKVLNNRGQKVLILAPTRELALQIEEDFKTFSKDTGIRNVLCIGGTNIKAQIRNLKKRYNFIIGTPGRVKDLSNRKLLHLNTFQSVVLDEADRMLDMGFIHDIKLLLSHLPPKRHSLFFSATVSKTIEELIRDFLADPVKVSVKMGETSINVKQEIVTVGVNQNKIDVLKNLLKKPDFIKVLVFGRTKRGVDKLSRILNKSGLGVESIHGDKTQGRRQRALSAFKENKAQVLIATDVASRGLDIDNVTHIINYDMPETQEDYVHRIGRTGRAGNKGVALTFVQEKRK